MTEILPKSGILPNITSEEARELAKFCDGDDEFYLHSEKLLVSDLLRYLASQKEVKV